MQYQIDQIIYFIPNGSSAIFSVKIIEEIVRKTINGVETSYIVSIKNQEVNISELKGEFFETTNEVKQTLIKRTEKLIDEMLEKLEYKTI